MIDGRPLRLSRPESKQALYRNESPRYQPEGQPVAGQAAPTEQAKRSQPRQAESGRVRSERRIGVLHVMQWLVVALALVLVAAIGWMAWSDQRAIGATIDPNKYQAVFLSNGQVYFGKLSIVNGGYMELNNVYYLERQLTATTPADEDAQDETTTADNNFQLLKYSDVLYGSEDAMIISSDDVIRYENLRPDGVVARAIADRR